MYYALCTFLRPQEQIQNMIATFLFILSPRLIAALCEPFLFTFLTFFNLF